MLLLDITIVNVALPTIAKDLHASFSQIQWVIDAYALTLASMLLTAGALADLFGRRLVFSIGLVLFSLTSLLCALSPTAGVLVGARAGQGIGAQAAHHGRPVAHAGEGARLLVLGGDQFERDLGRAGGGDVAELAAHQRLAPHQRDDRSLSQPGAPGRVAWGRGASAGGRRRRCE